MPAIKLSAFGGMIPAQDDRLLAETMAAYAQDTWLYSGAVEGIREPKLVHTCTNASARRVFRVPKDHVSKDYMVDSYWLEFYKRDVDVVKAPMDNDAYGRFYWVGERDSNGFFPRYNTRSRIAAGSSYYKLGVPAPTVAPVVSTCPAGPLGAVYGSYRLTASATELRRSGSTSARVSLDTRGFSVNGTNAVMSYRNISNVTTYDALTASVGLDPTYPTGAGVDTPGIVVSRAYVYTYVTGFSEEGPPSPPTLLTGRLADKWDVKLTAPGGGVTALRNITHARIYRTVTSSLGQSTYLFVAQVPIATTFYQDVITDAVVSVSTELQSTYWSPPPDELQGIIAMPNGMIAGFVDNAIWFCEPFRPHAWPSIYTLSVDFNILGLGVMGQTLIVCTEGATYACTGVSPAGMSLAVIGTTQPCLSRGGIVSTRNGVFYPSPNGIVSATPAGLQVVTDKLLTRDKWGSLLTVPKLHAAMLGNAYYTFGTVTEGCFQADAFSSTAFEETDYQGTRTGALIDPADPRTAFVALSCTDPTYSVFNDPWSGEVLTVRSGKVYQIDVASGSRSTFIWRSKAFQLPSKRNLEVMKIYFDTPDEAVGDLGTVRVYADDNLISSRPLLASGQMMRLPSGFKAEFWQVEIESRVVLWSVQIAPSARELASV